MASQIEAHKQIKATLEDLEEMYEKHGENQRYDLLIMVTSPAWITSGKASVWVEDPISKGVTILCSFSNSRCDKLYKDGFLDINNQYLVTNALINQNKTKEMPTYAPLQVLLDAESCIKKIKPEKRIKISYKPVKLDDIPKCIGENPAAAFLDIIAIPITDLGGTFPRRIVLIDNTIRLKLIWTLWDADATNEAAINAVMNKVVLIRNGLVKWFEGFGGEWQVSKPLCSVRTDIALPRMGALLDWFEGCQWERHTAGREKGIERKTSTND